MSDILSEMSDTQASPLTKDFKIDLPEDVSFIINTIEKNGHQAYAVGGCVRDTIMGVTPNDWDITTNALPEEVKSYFTKTIDTGIQHGTVTVMLHSTGYEVTTYRIDGDYLDGRHPSSVEFSDRLTDDLCRRDFTINAMAYNERTGLVDEYGGIDDINNKVIRCVGRPEERFTEDALRMMRSIRFSARDIWPAESTAPVIVRCRPQGTLRRPDAAGTGRERAPRCLRAGHGAVRPRHGQRRPY